MPAMRKVRARLGALVVGLAATAGVCALFAVGAMARLDDAGLDFHFRHFSSIEADPRIVLIDIDDSSLEAIGEWPWPRRRHADIIRTLHEAGAGQIVYDIVFAEPTPPRLAQRPREEIASGEARSQPEAAAHSEATVLSPGNAAAELIDDDQDLAAAIAAAGNVHLAAFGRAEPRVLTESKLLFRQHVSEKLRQQPELTLEQIERSLGMHGLDVTPEHSTLASAFNWAKSVQAIQSRFPTASDSYRAGVPPAFDLTPPIPLLAEAAEGFGVVSFERKAAGGVIREVPLLVNYEATLLPQLGFAAAVKELGVDWSAVTVEAGSLHIQADEDALRVPTDRNGLTLINWHTPAPLQWEHSFQHVPAARVLEVEELRRAIEANAKYFSRRTAELVRARHANTPSEYAAYKKMLQRGLLLLELRGRKEQVEDPRHSAELQAIDQKLREIEQEAVTWVEHAWRQWKDAQPLNEQESAARSIIEELHRQFALDELHQDLAQKNKQSQERIASLLAELESKVRGRICFVGYTASTVADFVASPLYPNMPGVMAHANVANMLLQGEFVRRAGFRARLGLIAAAGLFVTLLACAGNWRIGVLGLLTTIGLLALLGWWQFVREGVYLSTPVAAAAAVSAWAVTTALRQGTEERSRRHLQRALTQYTSPAIAARIAEQVGGEGLSPRAAHVTCFFADLRNFTSLSERLGAERTRDLLNPYLQTVTDVLVARGAMVNKFTGDGVFAFFNSPLLPSAEHARFACAAALKTTEAVDALRFGLHEIDSRPSGENARDSISNRTPLMVRIGLASGEAFVGDYGSPTKLDYTCIGDTVNIASRLEEANKFFGTRALVNGATRQAAGPEFLFRYMGRVLLLGKEQAVETYELLGRAGELDGSMADFVKAFEQAVRYFQAQSWGACADALGRCRLLQPHNEAVGIYEGAARLASDGSPSSFHGTIRAY